MGLSAQQIVGTWGTVLLPINPDESIDYQRLGQSVEAMIEAGVNGLYTNGTAGELHTQSEEEFFEINALVAQICRQAGVPLQIGASHPFAQATLQRIRATRSLEPQAYQIILPDWVAVSEKEAVAFLQRVALEAEGASLVLYNPPHAKRVFDPAALGRIRSEVPQLVGVKLMDGPASWYGAMRHHLPDFSVGVPGHHLATGVLNGAHCSYSNVACLSPHGAVRWFAQMQTDPVGALQTEQRINAFFQYHVVPLAAQGYVNPALDKFLATVGGWAQVGTRLRWPYRWIPQEQAEDLRAEARRMLPEFWAD